MRLDGIDDAVNAPARRFPDFRGGLGAVAADQLMKFELAVGSEKPGAAARRTAADDVFLDQDPLKPLRRNSAAALIPLNPPPMMSTSHLIAFVSGGQYLCSLIIKVVTHQF